MLRGCRWKCGRRIAEVNAILSNVQLAIQRADYALTKLALLAGELEGYISSVQIESECTISPGRDGYYLKSFLRPLPPATWKFTASEVVHHLRSALDNAAWHLANLAGPPLKPRDIAFPVVDLEANWEGAAGQKLAGVPRPAIDLIKTVQPFADSTVPKYGWLTLLRHLSNQDKHAELLRINTFSPGARQKVDIEYQGEPPTLPERVENMYFGEDGVASFVRTGGHVLQIHGSVNLTVDFVLLGPDGHPLKLIDGLAESTTRLRAMVDQLSSMTGTGSSGEADGELGTPEEK
jgi:hypothetical protein